MSFILYVCYSNRPPTGKVIIHCGRFSFTFCTPLLILQPPRIEPTTSGLMFRDCCGICVITLDVMIKLSVITENNKSSFIPTYCVNNCTLIQFVMTKKHFSSRHLNVTKKKNLQNLDQQELWIRNVTYTNILKIINFHEKFHTCHKWDKNYFQILFKDKVIPIHDKGAHSKFIKNVSNDRVKYCFFCSCG